jgi:hypothetical protein
MHSARDSWIYVDGETFQGMRQDIGDDPEAPWLRHAWKYLYTSKDTWLGPELNLGAIGATFVGCRKPGKVRHSLQVPDDDAWFHGKI